MIQMDIPAAFVCSQIFAWCGRRWLAQEKPSVFGQYTALAAGYSLGVIGACGLYLYSGWTEWEMMYWCESIRMDTTNFGDPLLALVAPMFVVALGIAGGGSFLLAHRWIQAGKPRRLMLALWVGVAVSLGMVLLTPSAPMFIGHYRNYHSYVGEAIASGRPWDYGIVALGPWKIGVPWAAARELLDKYSMSTFFDRRFFVPWLIDILIFLGSAVALARWFGRHEKVRVGRPISQA
jgi:hypothetical protein